MDNDTPTPRCANPACGNPFWPEQDGQKYCSTRCREAAKKRRARFRLRRGELPGPQGTTDESLTGHADARNDPRQYSDYGEFPDDADMAAEFDEQTARFRSMLQDADRTPRETWRKWRAYGRRHGTEDPEQTADRLERHRAAEAAKMARIKRGTAGRVQDRFHTRTASNVSTNAMNSRRLNAAHVERPPVSSQGFDFTNESVNGGPYHASRPAGQRSPHSDYAWDLGTTGFTC